MTTLDIPHSAECLAQRARMETLVAEANMLRSLWLAKWPNACDKCEGAGGFTTPATRDEPSDWSPCACVDDDKCPRCGKRLALYDSPAGDSYTDGDLPCPHCGWDWARGPEDVAPDFDDYDGECPCERAYYDAMQPIWDAYDERYEEEFDGCI